MKRVIAMIVMAVSCLFGGDMKRDDSTRACRRMMQTKQYVGCWSGGEMFGKFSIAFDPDGEGFLVGGMSASPFRWRADDKGNIWKFSPDTIRIAMIPSVWTRERSY